MSDEEMEKLLERQAKLQDKIDHENAWELDRLLEIAMDALRLPPADAEVRSLSGGERRRVALCKLLLEKPDLLLLDEPTNHLDAESVAWLERHLKEYTGSVILTTHDRYFLTTSWGGFWKSTGVGAFPGRAITPRGSNKKQNAWPRKKRKPP